MPNILTIAYFVEGQTDVRFLESIIQKTFENVADNCGGEIDVFPAVHIPNPKIGNFIENVVEIARLAYEQGIQVLCVHTDADAENENNAMTYKINPAFESVNSSAMQLCKNLVAIIPVRMSEAWMLADIPLFKEEIGTNKNNIDLGVARHPEDIANPKQVIEEAIRTALADKPKKSRNITISDIYQPLGQKLSLEELEKLDSFQKFKTSVENVLRRMNYLH